MFHRSQSPALPSARAKQLRRHCRARVRQRPPGRCRAIHVPRRIAKPVPMRRNPVPSPGSPRAPRYRRRFLRFPATLGRQFDRPAKFIKNFHENLPLIWILSCGTKLVPSIWGHGLGRFEKGCLFVELQTITRMQIEPTTHVDGYCDLALTCKSRFHYIKVRRMGKEIKAI